MSSLLVVVGENASEELLIAEGRNIGGDQEVCDTDKEQNLKERELKLKRSDVILVAKKISEFGMLILSSVSWVVSYPFLPSYL